MKTAYRYAWVRKDGLYMLASATATRRLALSMRGTAETVLRVAVIDLAEYRRLTRIDKLFDRLGGKELLRLAEQATKETTT